MLNLSVLNNHTYDEKDYYDYRKTLHGIYDLDVWYGDLVGDILAYREKDRHVESISIDMKSYKIYTELNDQVKDNDVDKVVESINNIVTNFIDTASDSLEGDGKELINKYNHSSWPTLDFYVNGSSIEFSL